MDKFYKPPKICDYEPNAPRADKDWIHWKRTFNGFISAIERSKKDDDPVLNKLDLLFTYVSSTVYEYISECHNFQEALLKLDGVYIKPKNEIYARHLLASRKQEAGEDLGQFFQALQNLSHDCNFKLVNATQNREEYIRDAYITGIKSGPIRQRLLESKSLLLSDIHDQARTLELAEKRAETWLHSSTSTCAATNLKKSLEATTSDTKVKSSEPSLPQNTESGLVNAMNRPYSNQKCYCCGNARHPRVNCPAKDSKCGKCKKLGHWARVCRSSKPSDNQNTEKDPVVATILASIEKNSTIPKKLAKASLTIKVNKNEVIGLADSCSSDSFIDLTYAQSLNLTIYPEKESITLATMTTAINTLGFVIVSLECGGKCFSNIKLSVLKNLCARVLLGHDILSKYDRLEINFGGPCPPLKICSLATINVQPPPLFQNLDSGIKPIADKSRYYSQEDRSFIDKETTRLLQEGIIEQSRSPWRAQVLVITQNSGKKRMVIDYSRTINRLLYLMRTHCPKSIPWSMKFQSIPIIHHWIYVVLITKSQSGMNRSYLQHLKLMVNCTSS